MRDVYWRQVCAGEEPQADDGERRRPRARHQQVQQLPASGGQARAQQEAVPPEAGKCYV